MDLSERRDNDSVDIEGTYILVMGGLSWKGGFVGRGRTNDRH